MAQKAKKLDQLCAVAARELGLGDLAALSVQDRIRVDDQVEQYVEQWEETVEMRMRRLLAEYQDICERILDEHDIDAGLWAYRKDIQKRRRPAPL